MLSALSRLLPTLFGSRMDHQKLVPVLETNLSRQLHWISAADSKTAFAFTLATVMLGVLAAVAPDDAEAWDKAPAIFASLAAALGVASLLSATFATFPRTKGPKDSLIYCGGIAERTLDQFRESVGTMTTDSYVSDLVAQCHRNAEIATAKLLWVQRALLCLYLSVPPWALALWLLYARTVQ